MNGNLILLLGLGLGLNLLGAASDELAVYHSPLNQPVVLIVAADCLVNTGLAEIEITIITSLAVIVDIRNCLFAVVAADSKWSGSNDMRRL